MSTTCLSQIIYNSTSPEITKNYSNKNDYINRGISTWSSILKPIKMIAINPTGNMEMFCLKKKKSTDNKLERNTLSLKKEPFNQSTLIQKQNRSSWYFMKKLEKLN